MALFPIFPSSKELLQRWPHTPYATVTMYAVLATLCFVETLDFEAFGGGATGLIIMIIEFTVYVGLSTYLLRSPTIRNHFRTGADSVERGKTVEML